MASETAVLLADDKDDSINEPVNAPTTCGGKVKAWFRGLPDITTVNELPRPRLWSWPLVIVILIFNTFLGIGFAIALMWVNGGMYQSATMADWFSHLIATAPMFGFMVSLGIPRFYAHFSFICRQTKWPVIPFATFSTLLWLLAGAILSKFNPLTFCMFFGIAVLVQGSLRNGYSLKDTFTYADATVWLFLWMMIDLRWIYQFMWFGVHAMSFDWWSLYISTLLIVAFSLQRQWPGFTFRLLPYPRDLLFGIFGLVGLMAVILPIGLAIGFLKWPPPDMSQITFLNVLGSFLEIFFTTAIPEELFFRGILLSGSIWATGNRKWAGLILSSLAFGLMHWVRETVLETQVSYVAFAVWAGLCYGMVFLLARRNLLASVITHALTDTVWQYALHT